ncbi:hypothetical protein V8G54_014114 [Vigna mungo]|uniref:Uncharacterized protein n=1 Tax=Vigna mungo TaxID=3915 RepID=A0AAQ3NG34_VIGMU
MNFLKQRPRFFFVKLLQNMGFKFNRANFSNLLCNKIATCSYNHCPTNSSLRQSVLQLLETSLTVLDSQIIKHKKKAFTLASCFDNTCSNGLHVECFKVYPYP